jgi:DNA-binding response OmpR family regulator
MIENKSKETKLVFVVEDEPDILELIALHLRKAGFMVETFAEAAPMLSLLEAGKRVPDLIILDLMMPGMDGLEVCKRLKRHDTYAAIPIIMATAKTDEFDVVLGLELGADDYISKPFSPRELVARVKAVLRRLQRPLPTGKVIINGLLSIDHDKFEVTVADQRIQLTSTEFQILNILAEKRGWVFSREKILDMLWGDDKDVFDRTVDVHIKNLRDKLGPAGSLIKNVRGVGYKLESTQE